MTGATQGNGVTRGNGPTRGTGGSGGAAEAHGADRRIVPVEGGICAVQGVRAAGVAAGLKPGGALDVALVDVGAVVPAAAVQTTNQVRAAPVEVTAEHVDDGRGRAAVLNSGGANACTGPAGQDVAVQTCARVAERLGCESSDVLVCSTGVIGRQLPVGPLLAGVDAAAAALRSSPDAARDAATAIMTTDTVAKQAAVEVGDGSGRCRVGGFVKGAGMVRPDMATMLCVVVTDAPLAPPVLRALLRTTTAATFGRISVDGCTSTNDAVLAFATGTAASPPGLAAVEAGLLAVLSQLAEAVVRDGEGASRLARIRVVGASTTEAAARLGLAVADSALFRTALAGGDPNWGRILAAMGASPVSFNPARVHVAMGPPTGPMVTVCRFGMAASVDRGVAARAVAGAEVVIEIDLGLGEAQAEVLTSDLTHEYVTINAEYTT